VFVTTYCNILTLSSRSFWSKDNQERAVVCEGFNAQIKYDVALKIDNQWIVLPCNAIIQKSEICLPAVWLFC
jgi:hypothetical protein